MWRIVPPMLLLGIVLAVVVKEGCWASRQNIQPPPNPETVIPVPTEPDLYGVVKAVDADHGTITLSLEMDGGNREKTYELAPDAAILNVDGPAKLADLSAGTRVGVVFDADHKTVADVRAEPFLILVKPKQNQVEVNKPFDVELRVVNASPSPQSFQVMSCSWDNQWESSNPHASWVSWGCWGNVPTLVKLASGESYKKILPMRATAAGAVSFQMGFTPLEGRTRPRGRPGKRTFWSSKVMLEVSQGQNK